MRGEGGGLGPPHGAACSSTSQEACIEVVSTRGRLLEVSCWSDGTWWWWWWGGRKSRSAGLGDGAGLGEAGAAGTCCWEAPVDFGTSWPCIIQPGGLYAPLSSPQGPFKHQVRPLRPPPAAASTRWAWVPHPREAEQQPATAGGCMFERLDPCSLRTQCPGQHWRRRWRHWQDGSAQQPSVGIRMWLITYLVSPKHMSEQSFTTF